LSAGPWLVCIVLACTAPVKHPSVPDTTDATVDAPDDDEIPSADVPGNLDDAVAGTDAGGDAQDDLAANPDDSASDAELEDVANPVPDAYVPDAEDTADAVTDVGWPDSAFPWCDAAGWCVTMVPFHPLQAVAGSGPSDIWFAGGRHLFHYDGKLWKVLADAAKQPIRDLWCASAKDCWAAAEPGLLHWDGVSWTEQPSPVGALRIRGAHAKSVWVAGTGGVARYDGSQWTTELAVPEFDATGLSVVDADEVWAVSRPGPLFNAPTVIWHRAGGKWQQADLTGLDYDETYTDLTDQVFGITAGPNGVWVGGRRLQGDTWHGRVFERTTGGWTDITPPVPGIELFRVARDKSEKLWAFGDMGTYYRKGGKWYKGGDALVLQNAMWDDGTNLWFAGEWPLRRTAGKVAWIANGEPTMCSDVHAIAPNQVLCGRGLNGVVLGTDGNFAQQPAIPKVYGDTVVGVWGSGPDDLWILVSNDSVVTPLRLAGDTWVPPPQPDLWPSKPACAIWGTGPEDVFVAAGHVARWDGKQVTQYAEVGVNLYRIWGAKGDIWAAGGNQVRHFDGKDWQTLPSLNQGEEIWYGAGSGADVWIAAGKSLASLKLGRWDGQSFQFPAALQPNSDVFTIGFASPQDAWLSGWNGHQHWSGEQWQDVLLPDDVMAFSAVGKTLWATTSLRAPFSSGKMLMRRTAP
jgi:hypothetical protein